MSQGLRVWWPKRGIATIEEFELPPLNPNQILLKAQCSLFNAGSETAFLYGLPNTPSAISENPDDTLIDGVQTGWDKLGWKSGKDFFPRAPEAGSISGAIIQVGEAVKDFGAGDRVQVSTYPHASHAIVTPDQIRRIPDKVTAEEALFAAPAHTALFAVQKSVIQLGEAVAVVGQGQIGICAVQFAKLNGARPVIAIDVAENRLAIARACGADYVINPKKVSLENEMLRLTGGAGAQVVIDASGNPEVLPTDFTIAGRFGRVVIVGSPRGVTKNVNFYTDVMWKNLFVMGAHVSGADPGQEFYLVPWQFGIDTAKRQRDLIFRLFENGDLKCKPMVDGTVKMDHAEVQKAYQIAFEEHEQTLNVILDWSKV